MLKLSTLFILSILFSVIIFTLLFQFISPSSSNTITRKISELPLDVNTEIMKTTPCLKKCINTIPDSESSYLMRCVKSCFNEKTHHQEKLKPFWSNIDFFSYLFLKKPSPDAVIVAIYLLIWFALFLQVFILLISIYPNNPPFLQKYHFHIVDTALNSPPILGVMGTIYSFAVYTTSHSSTDLIEGFKSSFFDASFTTIMAGSIYIVNLYLKIIILKERA